jgi:hypothetical protein
MNWMIVNIALKSVKKGLDSNALKKTVINISTVFARI